MSNSSIILADSRGRYMDWFLQQEVDSPPPVLFYPGTNLRRITRQVHPWLKHHEVSSIYLFLGINDTTWLDRTHNRVFARHYTSDELCNEVSDKIQDLLVELYNNHCKNFHIY